MAKKIVEGWQLFSNNDIFLERCAFNWSDVGTRSVLIPLNAFIRLHQNLNKILRTVIYTKDLWHTCARFKFWGVSGSEDRDGGDNSIQFINIGREGDKSFKE